MQKKSGISLIVLIITIIVMIILAATIIISLNNNGIIDKANDAVDKTNEKQVQELASLAWADAYADGKRTQAELQQAVNDALTNNNVSLEEFTVYASTKGVEVGKGWLQTQDRHVVKGNTVLEIGDYINYKSNVSGYNDDNGWKVLGAENEQILIMSTNDVESKTLGVWENLKASQDEYDSGLGELENACQSYGAGKGAVDVRSMTVEDVDKITGYDKTQYVYTEGTYQLKYGETITYYWDTESSKLKYPYYETASGNKGNLTNSYTKFVWYDGNSWQEEVSLTSSPSQKQKLCTLTQTYYKYNIVRDTDLKQTDKAYIMLFGADNENDYWLASPVVLAFEYSTAFGFRRVKNGTIGGTGLVGTDAVSVSTTRGVRAVVVLSSDVQLTGSSVSGWSIV